MKRLLVSIVLSSMILSGCSNALTTTRDRGDEVTDLADEEDLVEDAEEWMKEKALDAIEKLTILAEDEDYIKITSASEEILDTISEWSEASIDEDSEILVVDTNNDSVSALMSMMGEDDFELSDVAKEVMKSRVGGSIPSIINGRMGATYLAASSVVFYGKGYVTDVEFDNQLWIIPTDEEGLAYAINFQRSEEGIASVQANYIVFEPENTLKKSIKPMLMTFDVDIKEIDWE